MYEERKREREGMPNIPNKFLIEIKVNKFPIVSTSQYYFDCGKNVKQDQRIII